MSGSPDWASREIKRSVALSPTAMLKYLLMLLVAGDVCGQKWTSLHTRFLLVETKPLFVCTAHHPQSNCQRLHYNPRSSGWTDTQRPTIRRLVVGAVIRLPSGAGIQSRLATISDPPPRASYAGGPTSQARSRFWGYSSSGTVELPRSLEGLLVRLYPPLLHTSFSVLMRTALPVVQRVVPL